MQTIALLLALLQQYHGTILIVCVTGILIALICDSTCVGTFICTHESKCDLRKLVHYFYNMYKL